MVELTDLGRKEVKTYLREAKAKRREILDAGKDTADQTELPTEDDILMDILHFEENGEYCNTWGVTDNYNTDYPLYLKRNVHYKEEGENEMKKYNHPETCYVLLPTVNNTIGIVKWGENGYYKTNYPSGYTKEIVDELNDRLGCSRTEIKAMQICSMANLPETEDAWEKHFKMVCGMIDKHEKERSEN